MRTSEVEILLIPGLGNSGPDHWQSRWDAKLPTARRVVQEDWNRPQLEAWIARIINAVDAAQRPVVLVAHSLGVLAAIHATSKMRASLAGGFFVAPPSKQAIATIAEVDRAFTALPEKGLPYPSMIIASRDDPFADYADSQALAQHLGSELVDAGNSGHLNAESGHGPWPEGLICFARFLKGL
jgi:predicted alpha/beta hydrolase family esterase